MEAYEKKQAEYRKLQLERIAKLPEQQYEIVASGQSFKCNYCHQPRGTWSLCSNQTCPDESWISMQPLMSFVSQNTIRLDEQTRNRLDERAMPDDKTYQDVINPLLDNSGSSININSNATTTTIDAAEAKPN